MKNRYTVTYQSKLGMDGMNHRLEVRIKYKDIRDRDSDIFFIEKKRVTGSLLSFSSIIIIIVAILVLFMVLIVLFLYFMNREKEILKERFEIEKKYLMSQAAVEDDRVKKNGLVEGQDALSFGEEKTYGDAWLFQKNGPQVGKKYPINMREIIIGSGRDNAIVINDKTVSEKHSKIKIIQGMHTLFDLISDQGTYLNDKKLLRPKVLHDWDEIKIGSIVLIFRASQLKNS